MQLQVVPTPSRTQPKLAVHVRHATLLGRLQPLAAHRCYGIPHCEPALTGQPPNERNDHLQNHLLQTTVALQNHLLQNQADDHLQNHLLQTPVALRNHLPQNQADDRLQNHLLQTSGSLSVLTPRL